jgi:hypothetical protein
MDKYEISREDYKKSIELNRSTGYYDREMIRYGRWFKNKYGNEEVEKVRQEVLKEMKERRRIKHNERQRKYRENNKEKVKETERKYIENNKDKINERRKEYYNKNKDTINEKSKDYKSREYIKCECGSTIRKDQKTRHTKTKKHLLYNQMEKKTF